MCVPTDPKAQWGTLHFLRSGWFSHLWCKFFETECQWVGLIRNCVVIYLQFNKFRRLRDQSTAQLHFWGSSPGGHHFQWQCKVRTVLVKNFESQFSNFAIGSLAKVEAAVIYGRGREHFREKIKCCFRESKKTYCVESTVISWTAITSRWYVVSFL